MSHGLFVLVVLASAQALPAAELDLLNDPLDFSGAELRLRPYAQLPSAFDDIIEMTYRPDDARMYVATVEGTIFVVDQGVGGETSVTPWFNASAALQAATGRSMYGSSGQNGLRSLAFHPDFGNSGAPGYGKLFTTMVEQHPANAGSPQFNYLGNSWHGAGNPDGVLAEWTYDFASGQVSSDSYRELFRVNMPGNDHPIKQARFNPHAQPGDADYGLLYMTHADSNNQDSLNDDPQDLGDLMGKMIRINPLQSDSQRYTIPADNPFASSADLDVLKEIYAYGFRNLHTFSFNLDSEGAVHILGGDIGRDNIEEVNLILPGHNYGWTKREGTFVHHQFIAPHPDTGYFLGVDRLPENEATVGVDGYGNRYTYPVAQWDHNGEGVEVGADWWTGNAIATSYVIQNGSDPALQNQFIHLNFASNHGQVYHNDFGDLLSAVTQLDPDDPARDTPDELTQAENFRLRIAYDYDDDPSTPPQRFEDFSRVFDPYWSRSDARFVEGPRGEMYISSKWDARIYLVTNTLPYDADFDGDQDVDREDLTIWQSNQASVGYGAPGDANHDGLVNELDLAILLDQFVHKGDYNGDGLVDAADYTVWRDGAVQSQPGLAADGNGDGVVDSLDYDVWVAHFGEAHPGLTIASSGVPEPSTLTLLTLLTTAGATQRRRTSTFERVNGRTQLVVRQKSSLGL